MSNGIPDSGAPYIVICSGRIDVGLANNYDSKVSAAGLSAAAFSAFMAQAYPSDELTADLHSISVLQHKLMNHAIGVEKLTHEQIDATITELFDAMSAIEQEYA